MAAFATTTPSLKAEFRGQTAGLKRGKAVKAAAVNTVTEAKVKVAINGFGRIGASPSPRPPSRISIPIATAARGSHSEGPFFSEIGFFLPHHRNCRALTNPTPSMIRRPQLPPLLARTRVLQPRGRRHQRLRRCQAGVPPRQVRLHPRHLQRGCQDCRRQPHLHRRQVHRDRVLPRSPPAPLEEARRAARD